MSFLDTVTDEVKEVLEEKANHSIIIMLEFLTKHFNPWCNEHLPFALFSTSRTAQVVAQFVCERVFGIGIERDRGNRLEEVINLSNDEKEMLIKNRLVKRIN